jgi:ABC-2 type transport system permease protein
MPIFFLSGALFPIDSSSQVLKSLLVINPLSYGVDGIRGVLTGQFYFSLGIGLFVFLGLIIIISTIGSYVFSKIEA